MEHKQKQVRTVSFYQLTLPASTCEICAFPASKICSKCKQAHYCSKEHQLEDWKFQHSEVCKQPSQTPSKSTTKITNKQTPPSLFPEFELVTEEENIEQFIKEEEEKNKQQLVPVHPGSHEKEEEEDIDYTDKDFEEFGDNKKDKTFLAFQVLCQ
jgi:pre-rRNA-processing protein TSR4